RLIRYSMFLNEESMELDTFKTFGEIYSDLPHLKELVLQVQACAEPREKAVRWANNLKFLTPYHPGPQHTTRPAPPGDIVPSEDKPCSCAEVPYMTHGDSQDLVLLQVPECCHYVAVSYCWRPSENAAHLEQLSSYRVYSSAGERANRARPHILMRALRYAASYRCGLVWIDQECIDQDDREDKEAGIQSMDLVYKRAKFPVGLLNIRIVDQKHMDTLALIRSKPVREERHPPTPGQLNDITDLFEALSADPWFTRSWILQEVVCAGDIKLCIEHEPSLSKSSDLGCIPNEVEVTPEDLREAAVWADLAAFELHFIQRSNAISREQGLRLHEASLPLLEIRPGTQFMINERGERTWQWACNAAESLQLLREKQNRRVSDRLAIIANLCHYQTRINTIKADTDGLSFSLCVWVMALLNGDVTLCTPTSQTRRLGIAADEPLSETSSWLPEPSLSLDTLRDFAEVGDRLRMKVIKVSPYGLICQGFLYQLSHWVDLSNLASRFRERWGDAKAKKTTNLSLRTSTVCDFLVALLLELTSMHQEALVDALWHSTRLEILRGHGGSHNNETWLIPSSFQDMIETTSPISLKLPEWLSKTDGHHRLFEIPGREDFSWLLDRVAASGGLWSGSLSSQAARTANVIFDSEFPCHVFLPDGDCLEVFPRPSLRPEAISWRVEMIGERDSNPMLQCRGVLKGVWDTRQTKSQPVELSWPDQL
ncbi:MAG: hypothetical protein Q9168_007815, partial [Polycauliona sp. 1 TL-2023]